MRKKSLLMFLIFIIPMSGFTIDWSWQTYTSTQNITCLTSSESLIWTGTEGGLLAFDPVAQEFMTWTNVQGLSSNSITAIIHDANGNLWIGLSTGILQKYNPNNDTWKNIVDYTGQQITCFALKGDTLFVGLDIGVSVYNIQKDEVSETYHSLGFQLGDGSYLSDIPATDVLLTDNSIWVATNLGISHAELGFNNLLDPENWTVEDHVNIPSTEISSLAVMNSVIYVGTNGGVASWDGQIWITENTIKTTNLVVHRDKIYMVNGKRLYYKNGANWQETISAPQSVNNLLSTSSGLWATSQVGLFLFDETSSTWNEYLPNTMGSNIISALEVDQNGGLWCCSINNGFSHFDGTNWTIYNRSTTPELRSNHYVAISVDPQNNKWIGSWGGGLVRVQNDGTIDVFHSDNDYVEGIQTDPNYVVVTDIAFDQFGTTWILNREAITGQPLVSISSDFQWTYFGNSDGLTSIYLTDIVVDQLGRKWIGTNQPRAIGVLAYDDNGTPTYKNDDDFLGSLTTSDGLESNEITALAVDLENKIWIGTPLGLSYYWNNSVQYKYNLASNSIKALDVDGANNVWIGHSAGLNLFIHTTNQDTFYSAENSPLVCNDVTAIASNDSTGTIYIGTNEGISVIQTEFSKPLTDMQDLFLYPNPFVLGRHQQMIIDGLSWNVEVSIYSSSGFLVKRFQTDEILGRKLPWDGKDANGKEVSSGIYFVVSHNEEGEKRIGKFALIR